MNKQRLFKDMINQFYLYVLKIIKYSLDNINKLRFGILKHHNYQVKQNKVAIVDLFYILLRAERDSLAISHGSQIILYYHQSLTSKGLVKSTIDELKAMSTINFSALNIWDHRQNNYNYVTIISVLYEFERGSDILSAYESMVIVNQFMEHQNIILKEYLLIKINMDRFNNYNLLNQIKLLELQHLIIISIVVLQIRECYYGINRLAQKCQQMIVFLRIRQ